MIAKSKSGGLCTTCTHDQDCTFPRSPASPVAHCEEFDAGTVPAGHGRAPEETKPKRQMAAADLAEGLCCTCQHRKGCTFPRARKGVHRCEEFA